MSKNVSSAGNQQGSEHIKRYLLRPSETTRQDPQIKAYLLGALHDGTFSSNKRFRISQIGTDWLEILEECDIVHAL